MNGPVELFGRDSISHENFIEREMFGPATLVLVRDCMVVSNRITRPNGDLPYLTWCAPRELRVGETACESISITDCDLYDVSFVIFDGGGVAVGSSRSTWLRRLFRVSAR